MVATPDFAEHVEPYLAISPNVGEVLTIDSRLTFFSQNGMHDLFTALDRRAPRLRAGGHTIALKVGPVLEGTDKGYGSHARVLTPIRPLKAASEYHLEVRGANGYQPVYVNHSG